MRTKEWWAALYKHDREFIHKCDAVYWHESMRGEESRCYVCWHNKSRRHPCEACRMRYWRIVHKGNKAIAHLMWEYHRLVLIEQEGQTLELESGEFVRTTVRSYFVKGRFPSYRNPLGYNEDT